MKTTVLLFTLVLFSYSGFAQDDDYEDKPFKFGLGGTISLPLSDLKASTSYGVGFEVTGVYTFAEHVAVFAQTGINVFKGKSVYGYDESSLMHVPFLAGARFKAGGFFVGAGAGYGRFIGDGDSAGGFTYSPQAGYELENLQFMLHYTSTSLTGGSLSYVGLKIFRTF